MSYQQMTYWELEKARFEIGKVWLSKYWYVILIMLSVAFVVGYIIDKKMGGKRIHGYGKY